MDSPVGPPIAPASDDLASLPGAAPSREPVLRPYNVTKVYRVDEIEVHALARDYPTGKKVLEVLERSNRELGALTVVITHNAAIAGMADRVMRISGVRVGEPHAFKKVSALGVEENRTNVVLDFIDPVGALGDGRLPQTGEKGVYLKQQLKNKLIEHRQYI